MVQVSSLFKRQEGTVERDVGLQQVSPLLLEDVVDDGVEALLVAVVHDERRQQDHLTILNSRSVLRYHIQSMSSVSSHIIRRSHAYERRAEKLRNSRRKQTTEGTQRRRSARLPG